MRIDLHTHSRASDGTDTPRELVHAAKAAGLDVLAITDHDTSDGWAEATEAAHEVGITLVRGMEISTRMASGLGLHLLAYLPDPTYPPLLEGLRRVLDGRDERVPAILDRLREHDVDLTEVEVRRLAGGPAAVGRPHVADAMVAAGVVKNRNEAFRDWLGWSGKAFVVRYAAPLQPLMEAVHGAGGATVVAHPWGRHDHGPDGGAMDEAALAGLRDAGLAGIEVDHQDHSPVARSTLRAIARNLGLVVTGSSDYHGTGKVDHELGCNTTDPEDYARLLERAAAAAAASGRTTPDVVVA
ncbi:MAG: PHP domain-containing protein [Nocardioides sp.]